MEERRQTMRGPPRLGMVKEVIDWYCQNCKDTHPHFYLRTHSAYLYEYECGNCGHSSRVELSRPAR